LTPTTAFKKRLACVSLNKITTSFAFDGLGIVLLAI